MATLKLTDPRYDDLFRSAADRHRRDWRALKAQAYAESRLDRFAVSRAGAVGLTQFMPRTWDEVMGPDASPFEPRHAIEAQAKYMNQLNRYLAAAVPKGRPIRWAELLAAYNWGPGRFGELLKALASSDWTPLVPAETRLYVEWCHRYLAELVAAGGGEK